MIQCKACNEPARMLGLCHEHSIFLCSETDYIKLANMIKAHQQIID